jgi:exosome complex RNA-binding protein Csl4
MTNKEHDIIKTKIFKNNKEFTEKRTKRIEEAIAFEGGTIENPKKHLISSLPNGKEAYFFKPGKETLRKVSNVHDMSPNVGINGISETKSWAFENIWEYLIKISIISQSTFKKVLVLLYRNCFLLDHQEIEEGKLRYLPSKEISDYINNIEAFVLKDGFMDKFRTKEIGLLEYLYFIDLIGWNEDVKYHIVEGKPDFIKYDKKVGRANTILSVISAPLLISNFILDIIKKTETKGIIDVKLITSTIQMFTKSRGLCVLSNKELLKQLTPYLESGDE